MYVFLSLTHSLTDLCKLLHGHFDEYLSLNAVVLGDRGQRKPLVDSYDVMMRSSIKKKNDMHMCLHVPLGDLTIVSLSNITLPRGSFDLEVRFFITIKC